MNVGKLMQLPSVNAIIGGLLIYLLIYLSNLGSPTLGAVISSMPVGLLGLMAIEDNYTKIALNAVSHENQQNQTKN